MEPSSTYQLGEIDDIANVFKQALGNDEAPRQRFLRLLLDNLLKHILQIVHVIMFKPSDRAPADLDTLARSEVERSVGNNNVSSLAETGNHTAYRREGLCVDDTGRDTEVRRNVGFRLHVNILRAVEARRTARTDAVRA